MYYAGKITAETMRLIRIIIGLAVLTAFIFPCIDFSIIHYSLNRLFEDYKRG